MSAAESMCEASNAEQASSNTFVASRFFIVLSRSALSSTSVEVEAVLVRPEAEPT